MTDLLTLLTSGQPATTTGQGGNDILSILTMLIPLALMVVIFYFLIIRPEKRGKKMQEMLNNLEVADEVVTTGGIIGRVLRVTDDTVLIETGSDRTKIRILKSSIAENRTVHDAEESK